MLPILMRLLAPLALPTMVMLVPTQMLPILVGVLGPLLSALRDVSDIKAESLFRVLCSSILLLLK